MDGNPHVGLPIGHTVVPQAKVVTLNNVRDESMTQRLSMPPTTSPLEVARQQKSRLLSSMEPT